MSPERMTQLHRSVQKTEGKRDKATGFLTVALMKETKAAWSQPQRPHRGERRTAFEQRFWKNRNSF